MPLKQQSQIIISIIIVLIVLIIMICVVTITTNPYMKYKEYWFNNDLINKLNGSYNLPTQIALRRLLHDSQNKDNIYNSIKIIKNCLSNEDIDKKTFETLFSKLTKCVKSWCKIITTENSSKKNNKLIPTFAEYQTKLDDLILFYNSFGSDIEYLFSIKNQLLDKFEKNLKLNDRIEDMLLMAMYINKFNDYDNSSNNYFIENKKIVGDYIKNLNSNDINNHKIIYNDNGNINLDMFNINLQSYEDIVAECCNYTNDLEFLKKIFNEFNKDEKLTKLFKTVWYFTKDKKIILEYISDMVKPTIFGVEYTCCRNGKYSNLEQLLLLSLNSNNNYIIKNDFSWFGLRTQQITFIVDSIISDYQVNNYNYELELPNITFVKNVIEKVFNDFKYTQNESCVENKLLNFYKQILMKFL